MLYKKIQVTYDMSKVNIFNWYIIWVIMDLIRKSAIRGVKANDLANLLKEYKGNRIPSLNNIPLPKGFKSA